MATPFLVDTPLLPLAVTVADGAVRSIELNVRPRRRPASTLERQVAQELRQYFQGCRRRFSFAVRAEGTGFDAVVWRQLLTIPYGQTRTYGEVARSVGQPGAARAVGGANHRNPIPIVIPCHRVVGANGKLGGYGGGPDLKRRLLALEASHAPPLT